MVRRDDGSDGFYSNHTFIVHKGRDSKRLHGTGVFGGTISLELLACPGYFVTAPSVMPNSILGQQGMDCSSGDGTWTDDPVICGDVLEELTASGAATDACRGSQAGAICTLSTSTPRIQASRYRACCVTSDNRFSGPGLQTSCRSTAGRLVKHATPWTQPSHCSLQSQVHLKLLHCGPHCQWAGTLLGLESW